MTPFWRQKPAKRQRVENFFFEGGGRTGLEDTKSGTFNRISLSVDKQGGLLLITALELAMCSVGVVRISLLSVKQSIPRLEKDLYQHAPVTHSHNK